MKLNNKGFTLVEVLAVIVIIGIIMAVAIPSAMAISKRIKNNMFCTKVELLEKNAVMWGQDNTNRVCFAYDECDGSYVEVRALIEGGYVKEDDMKSGEVIDPRDNTKMNEERIHVYYKNNRIYAQFLFRTEDDESLCD